MAKKISKQDRSFVRTAMDFERKYDFDKSFSEAMNLAEQAKRQADEAYSVATNIKGIFFFIRYSAYADGTNMTEEPQADTVYMGTCSTNVDEAPTDKSAYTWTKILGNDGAKGEDGETGVGVSDMKAQYCISSNKTTPPTSGWKDTMDAWSKGTYLWIRHIITYTNGDVVATYPFCDSSWEAVNELDSKIDCEEIFLRLSKGNQGVYRDEQGRYYISAELVKAGIIKSKDGENVVIDLDNGYVKMTGTIQTKVTADKDEYGLSRQATFRPELISMSEKRENDDGSSNRCQTWIMPGSVYMYDSYYDANGSLTKRETIGFDLYNKRLRGLADPNINSDGSDAVNKKYVDGFKYGNRHVITVDGDANTYYPVLVDSLYSCQGSFAWSHLHISRNYAVTAPDSWYTSTHKGGLSLSLRWSGDTGWGGNDHKIVVEEFSEIYSSMVGGLDLSVNGLIVWLRGGTAEYTFQTDYGSDMPITVYLSTFTASDGKTYAAKSTPDTSGVYDRWYDRHGSYNGNISRNTTGEVTSIHNTGYGHSYAYFKTSDNVKKGSVGYWEGMTYIGEESGSCARIGVTAGGVPQFWSSYEPSTAKNLLHTGIVSDYPVAQATSGHGIWSFIKFNSGIAMCWGEVGKTAINFQAWNSVYDCDPALPSQALPFTFAAVPHVYADALYPGDGSTTAGIWLYNSSDGSTTHTPSFGAVRPNNPGSTIYKKFQLFVIGRWK